MTVLLSGDFFPIFRLVSESMILFIGEYFYISRLTAFFHFLSGLIGFLIKKVHYEKVIKKFNRNQ
jgi:hypothetical protein